MIWKIFARLPSDRKDTEDYAAPCYRRGVIAVGWSDLGDLNQFESLDALKNALAKNKHWRKEVRGKTRRLAQ
jgi:hypothetical protein